MNWDLCVGIHYPAMFDKSDVESVLIEPKPVDGYIPMIDGDE